MKTVFLLWLTFAVAAIIWAQYDYIQELKAPRAAVFEMNGHVYEVIIEGDSMGVFHDPKDCLECVRKTIEVY